MHSIGQINVLFLFNMLTLVHKKCIIYPGSTFDVHSLHWSIGLDLTYQLML